MEEGDGGLKVGDNGVAEGVERCRDVKGHGQEQSNVGVGPADRNQDERRAVDKHKDLIAKEGRDTVARPHSKL